MSDLRATLDYIQSKRFKKESGYETTLAKMLGKAKKAKTGKKLYEMRSKDDSMKFRAKGKKTSPVNVLDYSKIRSLTKSSPTEKTVAFACPGPNEKNPIMLYAMRFEKEDDYTEFTRRVEFPPPPKNRDSEYTALSTESQSQPSEPESYPHGKTTTTSSSSNSSTPTPTKSKSRSQSKQAKKSPSKNSYISTDCVLSSNQRRNSNPLNPVKPSYKTTYFSLKPGIRDSLSSYRDNSISRSFSHSSSISNYTPQGFRIRSYSTTSSDFSDDSYDENTYDRSGRRYVISRCRRDSVSGVVCRPVGKFILTDEAAKLF
ncbi:unnamed protein product [Rodentolepis nana]|uniref:DUF5734 domain-containing protein n=1 Tax=Rodentolepis nana TaxID=102285 RepID=A0A0R3TTS0_RODNA|nr:unnamed protein product [Rodentolepis nana]